MSDSTICPTCGNDYHPFRYCPNDHRGMEDKGIASEAVPALQGHLPECPSFDCAAPEVGCCACHCASLRACEARVLSIAGPHNYRQGRKDGYAAALDAATEAIQAELDSYRADCVNDSKIISLVAVDTFRHTMRIIAALRATP